MLIIKQGDEIVLSPKFHTAHNVAVYLHDQMASVLMGDEYEEFRRLTVDVPEGAVHVEELGDNIMTPVAFMEANQMRDQITDFLVRDIVQALLADFLHFVHESLSSAKRGKISVAYSLLRKPFADLLLLFEQILADKQDFIDRFHHNGAPVSYDPSVANLNKMLIVSQAHKKLALQDLFPADLIYRIRYDKTASSGIASTTHQALHIVTRNPKFHTPNREFNFVFDTVESLENYWRNYYLIVPTLLSYAASVMDEIVFDYLPTNERLKWVKNVQRFVLITNLQVLTQAPEIAGMVDEMFAPVLSAMTHTCKKCGHEIYFTKPDLVLFSEKTVMRCDECLTNQFTDDEFYTKFLDAWDDVVPMKLT